AANADTLEPGNSQSEDDTEKDTNNAGGAIPSKSTATGLSDNPLLLASAATNLALVIAVAILAFLWRRRPPPARHSAGTEAEPQAAEAREKAAFKKLLANDGANLSALRQHILHWARLYWPEAQIHTLDDIKTLCANKELNNLFTNMDNSLYGKHSSAAVDR